MMQIGTLELVQYLCRLSHAIALASDTCQDHHSKEWYTHFINSHHTRALEDEDQ